MPNHTPVFGIIKSAKIAMRKPLAFMHSPRSRSSDKSYIRHFSVQIPDTLAGFALFARFGDSLHLLQMIDVMAGPHLYYLGHAVSFPRSGCIP